MDYYHPLVNKVGKHGMTTLLWKRSYLVQARVDFPNESISNNISYYTLKVYTFFVYELWARYEWWSTPLVAVYYTYFCAEVLIQPFGYCD